MALFISSACISSTAATIPRGYVGGYADHLTLYKNIEDLAKKYCVESEYTITDYLPIYPGTEAHPTKIILCLRWHAEYRFSWNVACPNNDKQYPGHALNLPACEPTQKPPQSCPTSEVGNPINFLTRTKVQVETDYSSEMGLQFVRNYSSDRPREPWGHTYTKSIYGGMDQAQGSTKATWSQRSGSWEGYIPESPAKHTATVINPDGSSIVFASATTGGPADWDKDSDVQERLQTTWSASSSGPIISGYVLTLPSGDIENYNATGLRTQISFRSGRSEAFTFSDATTPGAIAPYPGLLLSVTDQSGRSIRFEYNSHGRMSLMKDPADNAYLYTYNADGLLETVSYPSGGGRRYTYNEAGYSQVSADPTMKFLLTGIHDEVEPGVWVRYSSFKYDSEGRPVATVNGNGLNQFTIDYTSLSVTDPLGTVRQYGYTPVNGVKLQSRVSQPGGAGCGPAAESTSYTADGDVSSRRDFNNVTTDYLYEEGYGLEKRRRIDVGTANMRTISTTWNLQHRKPTAIAEPERITTFTYDSRQNLLTETVQATNDTNGSQAFAAVKLGSPRTTTYTYSLANQVLTRTGPKGGQTDRTTYSYDDSNRNLLTITNAVGHVTRFSNYDTQGRVSRIVAPNGIVTDLTYSPRGWLKSKSVTAGGKELLTTYTYDLVGQLRTVTQPGGSAMNYTYDDARRLTSISDNLGNTITYTLDAIGNRLSEVKRDPNGTLTHRIAREFDALSRLKSQTGGAL